MNEEYLKQVAEIIKPALEKEQQEYVLPSYFNNPDNLDALKKQLINKLNNK